MGEIEVDGFDGVITIAGDRPTQNEAKGIRARIEAQLRARGVTGPLQSPRSSEPRNVFTPPRPPRLPPPPLAIRPSTFEEQRDAAKRTVKEVGIGRETLRLGMGRALTVGVTGTVGNFAGALASPVVGPVAGTLGGGAIGSAAGSILFDSAVELGEYLGIVSPEAAERTAPGGISGVAKRALREAAWDLAFGAVGTAAPAVGKAFTRDLLGLTGNEAGRIASVAQRLDIALGTQNVTNRAVIRGYPAVIGRIPFLGKPLRESAERITKDVQRAMDNMLDDLSPVVSLQRMGVNMEKAARETWRVFKTEKGEAVSKVDKWAREANATIPTSVRKEAQAVVADIERGQGVLKARRRPRPIVGLSPGGARRVQEPDFTDLLDTEAHKLARTLSSGSEFISIDEYRKIARNLNRLAELGSEGKNTSQVLASARMKCALEMDIQDIRGPEGLREALLKANAEYSEGMMFFSGSLANRFKQVSPGIFSPGFEREGQQTVNKLFKIAYDGGSPDAVMQMRRMLSSSPEVFNQAVRTHVDDIFTSATKMSDDGLMSIDIDQIRKAFGFARGGEDRLAALGAALVGTGNKVTPGQLRDFVDVMERAFAIPVPNASTFVARSLALRSARAGPGTALLGAAGAAGLGAGAAASGTIGTLAAGIPSMLVSIWTARAFGRLFTNPKTLTLLTSSLMPNARQAVRRQAVVRVVKLYLDLFPEQAKELETGVEQKVEQLRQGVRKTAEGAATKVKGITRDVLGTLR